VTIVSAKARIHRRHQHEGSRVFQTHLRARDPHSPLFQRLTQDLDGGLKIKHLVVLRGNHDDWFDEFCQTGHHPGDWRYGGEATAQSYWGHANPKAAPAPEDQGWIRHLQPKHIPASHRRFFAGLPLYHVEEPCI
jgi:hypothetical protein